MTFVDTSFLFAGFVPSDANHRAAIALRASAERRQLVTTNQVLGELWSLTRRREGHSAAVRVVDLLSDPDGRVAVIHASPDLEAEALAWLRRHDEREYSYVDATSFAFMRHNGITEALAFDGDFAAAGFVELRPVA